MMKEKNVHPGALACMLGIAVLLKYLHSVSTTDHLLVVLGPVNFLVELFQQERAVYRPQEGFYYEARHVLVDRSCAGVNFFIICFCTLVTVSLPYYHKNNTRLVLFAAALVLAWLLTVVTNASRIVGALRLLPLRDRFGVTGAAWFHEAQGALFYLTALVLAALAAHYFNQQIRFRYAKFS